MAFGNPSFAPAVERRQGMEEQSQDHIREMVQHRLYEVMEQRKSNSFEKGIQVCEAAGYHLNIENIKDAVFAEAAEAIDDWKQVLVLLGGNELQKRFALIEYKTALLDFERLALRLSLLANGEMTTEALQEARVDLDLIQRGERRLEAIQSEQQAKANPQ